MQQPWSWFRFPDGFVIPNGATVSPPRSSQTAKHVPHRPSRRLHDRQPGGLRDFPEDFRGAVAARQGTRVVLVSPDPFRWSISPQWMRLNWGDLLHLPRGGGAIRTTPSGWFQGGRCGAPQVENLRPLSCRDRCDALQVENLWPRRLRPVDPGKKTASAALAVCWRREHGGA